MVFKSIIGTTCTCLAVASFSVNANMIPTEFDWKVVGDGLITHDANTGLNWMDLTETAGMSYNEVSNQLGDGGLFAGWTIADAGDLRRFWESFGGTDGVIESGIGWLYADFKLIDALSPLWGTDSVVRVTTDNREDDEWAHVTYLQGPHPTDAIDVDYGDWMAFGEAVAHKGFFEANVALICDNCALPVPAVVPVPAAVWLFGSGLISLIGIARRKKV